MKRWLAALVAAATAGAAVIALSSGSGPDTSPTASGPTALETASLEQVGKLEPVPEAKFTRAIYATSTLARSELMLDFCRGPIAIDLGEGRPVLVAEHDFCGGTAWMPKLAVGEAIKLSGDGVEDGTYVVTTIGNGIRGKTRVRDLPHADIVLQTCVTTDKTVLVGMELFDPTAQS